jgi:hypothetical protein
MPSPLSEVQVCYELSDGAYTARRGLRVRHLDFAFSSAMPRGYVLDGKKKICVCLYRELPNLKGADRDIAGMRYGVIGGVSLLSYGPFDFERYRRADDAARDEMVLGAIEKGLAAVAREFGSEEQPIHDAAAAIRRDSYEYECETSLSRSIKNRRIRVHLFVRFERSGLTWRAEIRSRTGEFLAEELLMKRGPYFDIATDYRKSSLEGFTFNLFDWNGKRRATIDLKRYADAQLKSLDASSKEQ